MASRSGRIGGSVELSAAQVARLTGLTRLALGAAHTLNNALTAAIGEASFLLDDRKADGTVTEACQTIVAELDRCVRVTRGLQVFRGASSAQATEVDLVLLVRELSEILGETLGRAHQLEIRAPEAVLLTRGHPETLRLVVLGLVQYAAEHSGGQSRITVSIEDEPVQEAVALRIAVVCAQRPEYVVPALADPSRAPDDEARAIAEALGQLIAASEGTCSAAATSPDSWTALIHLPAAA